MPSTEKCLGPMSCSPLVDNEGRIQVGLYVSLGDFVFSGLRNVTTKRAVFEIGTGQPFDLKEKQNVSIRQNKNIYTVTVNHRIYTIMTSYDRYYNTLSVQHNQFHNNFD